MNVNAVDSIMCYALAVAAESDEWTERELGPIHLIKYVYLADLAHAESHGGETYTGAQWRFHHYGPWTEAVFERIEPAVQSVGAATEQFTSSQFDRDFVRYRLGRDEARHRMRGLEGELPFEVRRRVRKAVKDFGKDTQALLDAVYRTRPMLRAAPGEPLRFDDLNTPEYADRVSEPQPDHQPLLRPRSGAPMPLQRSERASRSAFASDARVGSHPRSRRLDTTRCSRRGSSSSTSSRAHRSRTAPSRRTSPTTSGTRVAGPKPIFPNDSIQSLVGGWWVEDRDKPALCRGRLLWAFVPFVDQEPRALTAEGRVEATDHRRALYKIEPLRVSQQRSAPKLPVAASPEFLARSRLSTAPSYARCGESTEPVDPSLTKGMAKWQAAQTVLVAPYFGITGGATRGGFNQVFVERIQRAEYPEYVWDLLPIGGSPDGSVLMLKQLQPIGRHYNAYELTPFRLSADALAVMDDWVAWLLTGNLKPDGVLAMFREGVAALG